MQKITKLMLDAFLDGKPFRRDNTVVDVTKYTVSIYLFGNKIASRRIGADLLFDTVEPNTFSITNCGWQSNTTKERLNALPNVHINQKKGLWYLNGEQWDGLTTEIQL